MEPSQLMPAGDHLKKDLVVLVTFHLLSSRFQESGGRAMHVYVSLPEMLVLDTKPESFSQDDWQRLTMLMKTQAVSLMITSLSLLPKVLKVNSQNWSFSLMPAPSPTNLQTSYGTFQRHCYP